MTPAFTVDDLLVGQHRLAFVAPPLQTAVLVGQSGSVHFAKNPLRPLVIDRLVGGYFFGPVVAPAHGFVLFVVVGDDSGHGLLRRDAGFDGIVFCWQAKSVPANGVVALVALLALEPGQYVADGVVHGVADVNPGPAGVVEHAHGDVFGLVAGQVCPVRLIFVPRLLPFGFNVFGDVAFHSCFSLMPLTA